jgi:hypothetical protein
VTIYLRNATIQSQPKWWPVPWQVENLNEITVVLGKNGSGKSFLLRGIRSGNFATRHYVAPERGGDISLHADLVPEQTHGGNRANLSAANAVGNFGEQAIARINAYLLMRGAEPEPPSGTSPHVLEHLLTTLLPELRFEIRGNGSAFGLQRIATGRYLSAGVNNLSSGEAQLFKLGIDLITVCALWDLQREEERILLIDEPDLHLHPDFQQRLAEFIVLIGRQFNAQVVVATHSTTLVAALGQFGGVDTSVIYMNPDTSVQRAVPFNDTLRELATCLGGHALAGLAFRIPLLLVEGSDEFWIWSQLNRHPGAPRLAVIPCGGRPAMRDYQHTLERLFSSLGEIPDRPVGFALVDGDNKSPPQASPQRPQDFVRYLQLGCFASENLYLADEVLEQMGIDWERAKAQIQDGSARFPQRQLLLEHVDAWDRQSHNLKDVIGAVSQILDENRQHWTVRVGKQIGRERPIGQLAEFLGESVLEVVWGPE